MPQMKPAPAPVDLNVEIESISRAVVQLNRMVAQQVRQAGRPVLRHVALGLASGVLICAGAAVLAKAGL